jgi:formylglycine-generating enzyme required for sulfatase activity
MTFNSKTCSIMIIALTLCVVSSSPSQEIKADEVREMAFIPAGPFIMGHGKKPPLGPKRKVTLRAFYIDRTEVTVAAYRQCAGAEKCMLNAEVDNPNFSRADYPVTLVSWKDAQAYCAFVGKRLPTEAEWERAARGQKGRLYPWTNGQPGVRANFASGISHRKHRFVQPVASFPRGATPEGVYDMAGNVAEWTADVFIENYHLSTQASDPKGPAKGMTRTVRGGDFRADAEQIKSFERDGNRTEPSRGYRLGFRCAKDAEE